QIIDDVRKVLDLTLNDAARLGPLGRRFVPSQIERVNDGAERVAELVREHRKELVHLPLVFLQRLNAPPSGEIARDLCKPTQLVVAAVERRGDDACPEAGTVHPQPPPFFLITTVSACRRKLVCRPLTRNV